MKPSIPDNEGGKFMKAYNSSNQFDRNYSWNQVSGIVFTFIC